MDTESCNRYIIDLSVETSRNDGNEDLIAGSRTVNGMASSPIECDKSSRKT
jgi:hypothetical protein